MKITKKTITASTKSVNSATIDDMIDAFETRLDELIVDSKTDVACAKDVTCDRNVEIYEEDYHDWYEDVEGKFGPRGRKYNLGKIKEMWNSNDSCEFDSFDDYWSNTKDNFLIEADSAVTCEQDIFGDKSVEISDSDYNEYYVDSTGMFGQDEHSAGETYSLGEIKNYWNMNYDQDYVLEAYDSFDDWWKDTKSYMEEYFD